MANNLSKQLEDLSESIESTTDDQTKSIFHKLLNIIETLSSDNAKLRAENQRLRDENNQLKGEQGQPSIRQQTVGKGKPHDSEKERKSRGKKKKKKSKRKKDKITVDRTEKCEIDVSLLPPDATFKGYQSVIIQDITISTDNIEFLRPCYYSPSLKKTFMADLPAGYNGEFGPKVKALVLELHHHNNMTQSAIVEFLTNHGLFISNATVSRMLTDKLELFHQEKEDIVAAGLASTPYQQMDDTGARIKGKNYYTHVLCNPLYTAFFTRKNKSRLTILDILMQGNLAFHFNQESYELMTDMGLPAKQLKRLKTHNPQAKQNQEQVKEMMSILFPNPKKQHANQKIILEASAIIAYRHYPHAVAILLTDDAPQFKKITERLALCWVHDGRHYKKLSPIIPCHRKLLDNFLSQYWDFYHRLLDYRQSPTKQFADDLEKTFDTLFATKTGYQELDERIHKTLEKKLELLLVLTVPELLLHNNGSELGARRQARYRDISFHTMSDVGTNAKDTFMTLIATAKKLAVNTYQYLLDRVSEKFQMTSLSDLIAIKAHESALDPG